jgi:hypothetical protein
VGHSERFKYWMWVEGLRVVAHMAGNTELYDQCTAEGRRVAREMGFKFPKSRGGKAFG